MSEHEVHGMNAIISSSEFARGLKRRIIILLLSSTLVVALMFGLTFYFALLSNETAVVNRMPELESVVSTMKRILLINTFAVAGILVVSLYVLSVLITNRTFQPLESIMRDFSAIGGGTLPDRRSVDREEPFAGFDEMFSRVLSALHEREGKEIEDIQRCLAIVEESEDGRHVRSVLEKMLREKNDFLGVDAADTRTGDEEDPLFLQPV
jgi:hypothetical protein